ncbi:MAG: flagellar basal-body rod protein FlgG [Planctomycetota bacterium]|jgi:flagellar basal-body rod protein FlgG|nr:flagellar basal-body rod protein FlgG [Planctomycetota bacterium]MDG2142322.1 flagellar basal-body rod protein FlgG [Planctomycetota bacterium]
MIRALRTASTGMQAQQRQVETIANNIANVNTTGFKKNRLSFRSLLYQNYTKPGANVTKETLDPSGMQIGTGTRVASSVKNHEQGDLVPTSSPLDVAIAGDGFFAVDAPDGQTYYTRDGALHKSASGDLVTADGFKMSDGITIPAEAEGISIGLDGTFSWSVNGTPATGGQLTLHRFSNPAGLEAVGDNYFTETPSSGAAASASPGIGGAGTIRHKFLERGNVAVVDELIELIQAQRNYELNSRTIKVGDEMMQQVNQMIR